MGKMTALALSDSRGDMMEDNKIMCNYNLPEVVRFRCHKKLTKIDFNFSPFCVSPPINLHREYVSFDQASSLFSAET